MQPATHMRYHNACIMYNAHHMLSIRMSASPGDYSSSDQCRLMDELQPSSKTAEADTKDLDLLIELLSAHGDAAAAAVLPLANASRPDVTVPQAMRTAARPLVRRHYHCMHLLTWRC